MLKCHASLSLIILIGRVKDWASSSITAIDDLYDVWPSSTTTIDDLYDIGPSSMTTNLLYCIDWVLVFDLQM